MSKSMALPAEIDEAKLSLKLALLAQGPMPPGFDFDHWLTEWLMRTQAALGGSRPADLLATPEGIESVRRALGASMSGAYQ